MNASRLRNIHWSVGVFLSALVTFFSMPPFGCAPLMFVAVIPVFSAMETATTWRQAAFRAWLFVFLCNMALCIWVAYCVHEFAKVPWILSYPCVILVSIFEQGAWPVVAALRHVLHKRYGIRPLLWTPIAMMVVDSLWPKLFPDTLGNVLYCFPRLCQIVDVFGICGLTALLVATNEIGAALLHGSWPRRELKRHLLAVAGLLVVALGYGNWRHHQIHALMGRPSDHLRVGLVQPNVGSLEKVAAEAGHMNVGAFITQRLDRLSTTAIQEGAELVVWPETAYPATYHGLLGDADPRLTAGMDRFILAGRVPYIFGAYDSDKRGEYNSLFMATPGPGNQIRVQRYHKAMLLVPSEHLPWSGVFPRLGKLIQESGGANFIPGPGPIVFTHPKARLGVMICLEGLYARFVRELAREDAQILVNATNDSWFGPGIEQDLHLHLTTFRCIETRLPLVRVTNTGYTAVVDIDGSLLYQSAANVETVKTFDVPIYPKITTPFVADGNELMTLAGLWALWPLILVIMRSPFGQRLKKGFFSSATRPSE
jgi:apolipoprotein N-acyltransferase